MSAPSHEDTFDLFWRSYPKRVAKADARRAWLKLKPSLELVQRILVALEWQRETDDWQKDGGQFTPYPASWLRSERWDDEPPDVPANSGSKTAAAFSIRSAQDALEAMHGLNSGQSGTASEGADALGPGDEGKDGGGELRDLRGGHGLVLHRRAHGGV